MDRKVACYNYSYKLVALLVETFIRTKDLSLQYIGFKIRKLS